MSEQKLFDAAVEILQGEAGNRTDTLPPADRDPGPAARFPLHWLSDLGSAQAAEMARLWSGLPLLTRRDLIARMEEEARENFEVDFLAVARIALNDVDPEVRVHAIRSFWESGDPKLVERFIQFMEKDPDLTVRASAAEALGPFVERAELEEIPPSVGERITARLISVIRGKDDLEVRRRAVESVGYASDPQVRPILDSAHAHSAEPMRASALRAMGRSADTAFVPVVADELRNPAPILRAEAARAAGALGMKKSVRLLIELLEDVDPGVRGAAIDALGEIGGGPAREALEKMLNQAAGDEFDRIEMALENAEFEDSLGDLPLLDIEELDELDEDEEEDGEEDEDEGE
ncbi:MAG: HEAT repeat domain-containing protein [Anaerolineales bacterium]|nr:HEAT repeat domain-containing protein [Anaerolineales bacterium]